MSGFLSKQAYNRSPEQYIGTKEIKILVCQ